MNIVVIKEKLKTGIDIVSRISTSKESLPILQNILFKAENGNIYLTSTNLEVAVTYLLSGKVIENGSFTVPSQLISQLVNTIQQERITLFVKDSFLEIKTDNYNAKIHGSSSDEFPIVPKIKNPVEYLSFSGEILKAIFEKILSASQFSELRQELNSILLKFSVDNIIVTATDSFRLAEKKITGQYFNSNQKNEFQILIPLKTAQEITRILSEKEEIKIYHDENQVLFETSSWSFISRLIDGSFPDYKQVIPKKFDSKITLKREELLNAVKSVSIFGMKSQEVKIKSGAQKNIIEIFSHDDALGENTYIVSAKIEGSFDDISFNWKYLIDGIKACDGEDVLFCINNENKPSTLSSPKDSSFFYLLMPIVKH